MEVVLAQKKRVRSPVGAGMFYPDEKAQMLQYLRSFNLEKGKGGQAKAIIAPHGAWDYSGRLAADAFYSGAGRSGVKRVVLLGPCHDKRERGLFLSNSYAFYTPIGDITVDQKMTEEIEVSSDSFEINDIPHLGEHSIEILLPFVKYCFPNASIVPILMGQPQARFIYDLAYALKTVISPVINETLIAVSCNLSSNKDEGKAKILAEECLRLFLERNSSALVSAILEGRLNACGGALVVSLIESGILEKTTCSALNKLESAVSAENNTVFYSGLFYE
ncbi:MAG: AmmeMemoRadiSam system protein B [Treponema sp.]|nr:AmmeMemoRadiSam system protein B [Treponema sp.]MCL2252379.1 AmmeMemoRadiSam system protein B [Treponema sp.]